MTSPGGPRPGRRGALGKIAPAAAAAPARPVDRTVGPDQGIARVASAPHRDELHTIRRRQLHLPPGATTWTRNNTADMAGSPPSETGCIDAQRGIPAGGRAVGLTGSGFALLWETITQAMVGERHRRDRAGIAAATDMWGRATTSGKAVHPGYRDATTEILRATSTNGRPWWKPWSPARRRAADAVGDRRAPRHPHSGPSCGGRGGRASGGDPLPASSPACGKIDVASACGLPRTRPSGLLSLPEADPSRALEHLETHATGNVGVKPAVHPPRRHPARVLPGRRRAGGPPRDRTCGYASLTTPRSRCWSPPPGRRCGDRAHVLAACSAARHDRNTLLDHLRDGAAVRGFDHRTARGRTATPTTRPLPRMRKLAEHTGRSTEDPRRRVS